MSEVEQSVRGGREGVDVSRSNGNKTKRILLVEEEPLLGVAILNNLRRVGFAVDVASNGTIALEKLRSSAPDAIFLDLMLPNIDNVEVISEARREPEYADLPIYVYTSAFPMKMSRRAAKAGATQIFDKISIPLDEVAAEVASQLIGSSAAVADAIQSDPAESEAINEITAKLPECVGRIHRHLQELVRCKNTATRATKYGELRSRVHLVVNYAILAGRYDLARLAATLQSLLNVLREKPRYGADSGVRTISFAVEVLGLLCAGNAVGQSSQLAEFTAVLVDDELTSRSVVCSALRSTGFNLTSFADPIRAVKHLQSHSADLIVLKAVMRETNGFDLCKKLRLLPAHRKTPVIFVGDPKDFQNQARTASCGPNDFITRPFIFQELSLKAISLVLKNRLSSRVGTTGGAAVAPQAKRPDAGPQEQRTKGAVPVPAVTTTRVQESNTALYRANEELKQQLQAVSAEAATLRQTLEKKQKEREELSARPLSGGTELDRVRTALEQERQQRQRLEKKLQEMAAPQAVMSREQSVDDLPGRFTAPTGAATGARESNTTQSRADEELKQQLQAMSAEAAGLREALEKKQKEREELVGRIFADGAELEQVRTALEQERQQRQQLETSLQEMTANQAGQVVEPKPVGTESSEQWNATETARLEDGPRSIREELTGLQQQRDELSSQLVLAQQAAAGSQQHSTGLETRLWETTEDLERARIELEQERAQRQQLETSLQEMTANQAGQVVEPEREDVKEGKTSRS